ncbi:MAG: hypothetical protein LUE06_04835 [Oscillospiraceae bacterium]|nr:hypothetical protein [Oscillospiraceae bacterium]
MSIEVEPYEMVSYTVPMSVSVKTSSSYVIVIPIELKFSAPEIVTASSMLSPAATVALSTVIIAPAVLSSSASLSARAPIGSSESTRAALKRIENRRFLNLIPSLVRLRIQL